MGEAVMVGMAEVKWTQSREDVLMAAGLGSCVCICAYEPDAGIAIMAHVVLPDSGGAEASPGKFADTAVPYLVQKIESLGGVAARIRVALVGGAELFACSGPGPRLEIGQRNVAAIQDMLNTYQICVPASDLAGNMGRSVQFTGDGRVCVKWIGQNEKELIQLGHPDQSADEASLAQTSSNSPVRLL